MKKEIGVNKDSDKFPYLEYDAEMQIGYVHFSATEKSRGCITIVDIESAIYKKFPESYGNKTKREKTLKIILKQAQKFNINEETEHIMSLVENSDEEPHD